MAALEVSFSAPSSGWIVLRLEGNGCRFEDSFSSIYPSLEDLCGACCDAVTGIQARRVKFLLEPSELEFAISPVGEDLHLSADVFPDHRRYSEARSSRVFELCAPRPALVLPFWRALRKLQTCLEPGDFEREWREPFPETAMASLTALVRAKFP